MCAGHRYPRSARFLRAALSGSGECCLSSFLSWSVSLIPALTVVNPLHEAPLIAKVMDRFTTGNVWQLGREVRR